MCQRFFFKKIDNILKQRFDVVVTSPYPNNTEGKFSFNINDKSFSFNLDSIPFGESRHEIYIPDIKKDINTKAALSIDGKKMSKQ